MRKQNSTKRAWLASVLSLLLCVSMLVGTTFAWFTDTAKTGVNTIQSGNLDLVLEYWDGTNWTEVSENTKLFKEGALWEPGYTEVAYIRVRNNGSLAFKYQLAVNAANEEKGTNVNGQEFALSQYIQFGVVESATEINKYATREDAWKAVEGKTTFLNTYNSEGVLLPKNGETEAGVAYLALVVYMPTTTGNEANHNGDDKPSIDLGVTVNATQTPHENDSFGNDYDKNAAFTITAEDLTSFIEAVSKVENNGTILLENAITVTQTTDGDLTNTGKTTTVDFGGTTATGSNGNIAFRARGNSVVNFKNGTVVADANTWSAISAAGNENGKAVANISDMTLSNSKENGNCVKGFDNSEVNIQDTTINSSVGGCVEMANGTLNIYSGTFTQTGKTTETYDANSMNVAVHSGGTANIYGGTYSSETYGLCVFNSGGTMNVYGGTFKADKAVLIANEKATDAVADCVFNIYGGSFDGKIWMEAGAVLNIYEGTFTNTTLTLEQFKEYVAEGSTVTEANGVFTVTK